MTTAAQLEASQRVRFCRSSDGVRIAYAVHGHGPPVVLDACWLSHLEFDWRSPVWRHYLVELGRVATVIRFDERGHGLSDREVSDFSLRRRVDDLAAVVDDAGLDRFALIAMAQGGPVSLHYQHEHPGRVTRFVMMIPDAGEEQMAWLDDLHQRAVSARTAYLSRRERGKADATHLLPHIDVPTLVVHSRHERMNSFEHGRALAAGLAAEPLPATYNSEMP